MQFEVWKSCFSKKEMVLKCFNSAEKQNWVFVVILKTVENKFQFAGGDELT